MRLYRLVTIVAICLLLFVPITRAASLSIGISPSEKEAILKENEGGTVFFAVSQGSDQIESIEMSTDVDWLELDPETFDLEPFGQKFVEVKIKPLEEGNYNASIKASASLPGLVGVRQFVTARLTLSVITEISPETEAMLRDQATTAIDNAEKMINDARKAGADTGQAESLLANALAEFSNENYIRAIDYADAAYDIASALYDKAMEEAKTPLIPIQNTLLIIIFGSAAVAIVILFEVYKTFKARKNVKKLPKAKGEKCPKCGRIMVVGYRGQLVLSHICPKCKHIKIGEKVHSL